MLDKGLKTFCPRCEREFDASRETCPDDGVELLTCQVVDGPEEEDLVGEILDGRFEVREPLSEGAMGQVFRGVQTGVGREVAIKVLRPGVANDETVVRRFLREARVAAGLNHPNIVNFVDFGRASERNVLYLVMEMIEGRDLRSLFDRGRLYPELAAEVGQEICAALTEPHDNGVIHRDLKPANIMLLPLSDGRLQVKIVDFGIANASEGRTTLTKAGEVCGTPHYMSPEQTTGEELGPGSDIYSVGAILFEALTGDVMYRAPSAMQIMYNHAHNPPPEIDVDAFEPRIPPALAEIVESMVRKEGAERPSSALALRDRFAKIRKQEGMDDIRVDPTAPVDEVFDPWVHARGEESEAFAPTAAHTPEGGAIYQTGESAESGSFDDTVVDQPGSGGPASAWREESEGGDIPSARDSGLEESTIEEESPDRGSVNRGGGGTRQGVTDASRGVRESSRRSGAASPSESNAGGSVAESGEQQPDHTSGERRRGASRTSLDPSTTQTTSEAGAAEGADPEGGTFVTRWSVGVGLLVGAVVTSAILLFVARGDPGRAGSSSETRESGSTETAESSGNTAATNRDPEASGGSEDEEPSNDASPETDDEDETSPQVESEGAPRPSEDERARPAAPEPSDDDGEPTASGGTEGTASAPDGDKTQRAAEKSEAGPERSESGEPSSKGGGDDESIAEGPDGEEPKIDQAPEGSSEDGGRRVESEEEGAQSPTPGDSELSEPSTDDSVKETSKSEDQETAESSETSGDEEEGESGSGSTFDPAPFE